MGPRTSYQSRFVIKTPAKLSKPRKLNKNCHHCWADEIPEQYLPSITDTIYRRNSRTFMSHLYDRMAQNVFILELIVIIFYIHMNLSCNSYNVAN